MQLMKIALIGFIALTGSAVMAADVTSANRIYLAELKSLNTDSSLGRSESFSRGAIEIDLTFNEVRLSLVRRTVCPKGSYCIQLVADPVEIVLPIVSESRDECNVRSVVSRRERMVGGYEQLVVVDNSKNNCSEFGTLPDTEVLYTHFDVQSSQERQSFFQGDRLSRVKDVFLSAWQ